MSVVLLAMSSVWREAAGPCISEPRGHFDSTSNNFPMSADCNHRVSKFTASGIETSRQDFPMPLSHASFCRTILVMMDITLFLRRGLCQAADLLADQIDAQC